MDHLALFNAVKAKDVAALHEVLGPTLRDFGAYRVVHWAHAYDGVLTSLNALPGVQGYEIMRWAEQTVIDSLQQHETREPNPELSEYVYKLRAALLGKALERIDAFTPEERVAVSRSVASAVEQLGVEVASTPLASAEWLEDVQNHAAERVAEGRS